ncbi:LCCL domain-containing protein [Roseomonas sp. CCTCC AB2023176]|uniref:LCCL domain-containing protein n=1 Tax=Roseomonas sp. CCTCC AB2023176 TaxID=3342640 RepID=UPI0035DC54A1
MMRLLGVLALLASPALAQDAAKPPPAGAPVPEAPGKPGVAAPAAPPAPAPRAAVSQCPDNMAAFAGSSEVLTCACPAALTRSGPVWGTDTYTADSRTCRAAVHAGAIGTGGGEVTVRMLPGQPRYLGTTRNGFASTNYGSYAASYRFDLPVGSATPAPQAAASGPQDVGQCPDTLSAFQGSTETLTCTCPDTMTRGGAVWGSDTYTADSRTCRAAVHAGAIPLSGGRVTITMLPGAAIHPGTTRNGVTSTNHGAYATSFRFEGVQRAEGPGVCPDNMDAYRGSGEQLRCTCPAEATRSGAVWGTDVYTSDSRTCRAAVHAGAVGPNGGLVSLRMMEGQARYPGTTRNGVSSTNYGNYAASFQFIGVQAGPALCPDTMSAYAGSTEVVACLCPGERTLSGAVWGTDTYTADSRTCRAAVHAGAIPLTGGMVKLTMMPGQPRYLGTTRNGVQSTNYGAYEASYRIQAEGPRATGPVQAPVAEALRTTGTVALYITFRTNSADLDANAVPVLMQVRDALNADPSLRLRLVGHTDNTGNDGINIPLSGRRAESVRAWLVANGVSPDRVASEGRGATQPIANNADEAGRSLNRRVQAVRVQ